MEASAVPRLAPTGVSGVVGPRMTRLASDTHLVALVRQGWPSAFETIYGRYHRAILSFCRHMLGDADEAEDVVQHTFLAAYNDLISSEKPIQLRPWLFTIARNRCYSVLRARREQPQAEITEPATEGLAIQVQRRQDLRDLVGDLRGLPDDQRAALVLAEIDALSHEQIGEVLGVPSKKVKALVFQARESLVASRTARETACSDIREQLANARGAVLRRSNLRRHLRDCQGCRDFRRQVERQRSRFALLLPVAPTLALKDGILGATIGAGAATGIATGGFAASSIFKSSLLKSVIGVVLAGAGAGTYVAANHAGSRTSPTPLAKHPAIRLNHGAHAAVAAAGAAASSAAAAGSHQAIAAPAGAGTRVIHDHAGTIVKLGAATGGTHRLRAGGGGVDRHRSQAGGGQASRHGASGGSAIATHHSTPTSPRSNAPYLGSSAYGSGTQPAGGTSRGGSNGGSASAGASNHTAPQAGPSRGANVTSTASGSAGAAAGSAPSSTGGARGGSGSSSSSSSHSVSSAAPATTPPAPASPAPAPSSSGASNGGVRGAGAPAPSGSAAPSSGAPSGAASSGASGTPTSSGGAGGSNGGVR